MCESFTALTISAMNKKSKDFFESLLSFFCLFIAVGNMLFTYHPY
jgi:hypothetical protein